MNEGHGKDRFPRRDKPRGPWKGKPRPGGSGGFSSGFSRDKPRGPWKGKPSEGGGQGGFSSGFKPRGSWGDKPRDGWKGKPSHGGGPGGFSRDKPRGPWKGKPAQDGGQGGFSSGFKPGGSWGDKPRDGWKGKPSHGGGPGGFSRDKPRGPWKGKPAQDGGQGGFSSGFKPRGPWQGKPRSEWKGKPSPGGRPEGFSPGFQRRDKPRPWSEKPPQPPAGPSPTFDAAPEPASDDFVFGRHPVLELLRAEGDCRVNKLWLLKGAGGPVDEVVRLAQERRVVFQWVDRDRLDEMVRSANHQGVVARVSSIGYGSLDDLLKEGTPAPLVLLDGIEDPHNVGAILRSAAFFGAKAVVVPRWRSAGLSGTVMKASAGALAKIPLVQVANIAQTLLELKAKGYWIYGADGGGQPAPSIVLNAPLVLVIGAEGTGLHRLVKERCDGLVAVPGSGGMESLNASCAAAVLLHEIFRRGGADR